MECKLIIHDEVNVEFVGLRHDHKQKIIERTKLPVKGARNTAAYRIGAWDGKESLFREDGVTLYYMLDQVLDIVEELGYEVDVDDRRKKIEFTPDFIDDSFLSDTGINLYYYQVDAVNSVIEHEKGILKVSTSGGKTLITAAIAKAYESHYRTLVIVPSENLVQQTAKDMNRHCKETGAIWGKVPAKKREQEWNKHHVVITWQTLNNSREYLKNFDVVVFDECHNCGEVMYDILRFDLAHAHVRVGLTGTVPKDKQKAQKIMAHLGGDLLCNVGGRKLMDEGYVAKADILMVPVDHKLNIDTRNHWDWDMEFKYMMTNRDRIKAIADYIKSKPTTNTLILTHPRFGEQLAQILGTDFIDQDVDGSVREEYYRNYDSRDDYVLVASYGTVGTGISINDIYRLYLIDVGKDYTKIIQGIGRGLRKDSKGINEVDVYDIYSKMPFSSRHAKERQKIYKQEKYPFTVGTELKVN